MARIHPTALVEAGATLAEDVEVGPYSLIASEVTIGAGTRIGPHAVIRGRTRIGERNRIYQFTSIGEIPQDRKYTGEPTLLTIGDDNVIREFVSIHTGTTQDRGVTSIGNGNWLLAYVHIAHDCVVGSNTTFSNNAQLAGHVVIEDWVTMGGFTGVHQFCRVGAHAMVAAGAIVLQDVPPYVTAVGYPAKPHGTNNEGLRRRGFTTEQISAVRRAYKTLYREGRTLDAARTELEGAARDEPVIAPLAAFLASAGRGIIR